MRVQRTLRSSHQLTPKHRPTEQPRSLSEKEDLRLNRLRLVIDKLQAGTLHNREQLFEILACQSFFESIHRANPLVFAALKPHITVQIVPKGRIISMLGEKALKSFLILRGCVGVYVRAVVSSDKSKSYKEEYGEDLVTDPINKNPALKRRATMVQEENAALSFEQRRAREYDKIFMSEEEMLEWFPDLTRVGCMRQEEAIDAAALKKNITRAATLVTQQPTVLVGLSKSSFLEVTSKLQLHTVLDDRLDMLRSFPIFSGWEKKLNATAVYFQRRRFQRGEIIYREGQSADCFYLILEGDVELSVQIHRIKPASDQFLQSEEISKVPVNLLGPGNYFGEEEILRKTARTMTAQPLSAYVQVLYLTKKNFFLVGYGTDFFYQLKLNLQLKAQHRQNIVQRYSKFQGSLHRKQKTPQKSQMDCRLFLNRPAQKTKLSRINNHPPVKQGSAVVFLHGNKISIPKPQLQDLQPVQFSMLKCNAKMYEETYKKFRRFHKEKEPRKKSEANWDMKRVWKVLNLEEILPEEIVSEDNPIRRDRQAIKYYYKSNRLANQINEARALRPRTSSSSHRQKQTYINYLSEFIDNANRRISLA